MHGRLSHPNIVKLLGYCWENKELFLVYEFMQEGSLASHLFGRRKILLVCFITETVNLASLTIGNLYPVFRGLCASRRLCLSAAYMGKKD